MGLLNDFARLLTGKPKIPPIRAATPKAPLAALVPPPLPPTRPRASATPPIQAELPGPGEFRVEVVGESHYQQALEAICGGRCEEGHEYECTAVLVLENNNPYDNKAVRVDIEGYCTGYLSRENARAYRKELKKAGYPNLTASCDAMIVGGWDRGRDDQGHFGVRLDLPSEGD